MNPLLNKAKAYFSTIGEGVIDLLVSLIAMVFIARIFGQRGLGVFSYLLSLLFVIGYLSEFGIPKYVERETAVHHGNTSRQSMIYADARKSIMVTGIIACLLFFAVALSDFANLGKSMAFMIIGLTLPFRNHNRLRIDYLQGSGEHAVAAKLKMRKRFVFMTTIVLFLFVKLSPVLIVSSFLISEVYVWITFPKRRPFIRSQGSSKSRGPMGYIYREGYKNIFTDDAMEVLLYIDFLILGLFTTTRDVGVYAEASIIARSFLLIPLSIKSINRQAYCALGADRAIHEIAVSMKKTAVVLFAGHAILALFIMLHFPYLIQTLFRTMSEHVIGFWIFSTIIPGLLFFSAVIAIEPVYEAIGQTKPLKRVITTISILNICLNIYLVPFARYFGAATATMVAMLTYFLLFGNTLPKSLRLEKSLFVSAGAGVYLIYAILRGLKTGFMINVLLVPFLVFLLFWSIGFISYLVSPVDSLNQK